MRAYDIIKKKRDGETLTAAEIEFIIGKDIPDYQLTAFAMAVWFRGMTPEETAALTRAMMLSGDTVDLSEFGDKTVDKHSTGGVGDKTSLIVLPVAAACGAICAKMSGRGLGHTGGTVDKLESIKGFKTTLSRDAFLSQVRDIGIALVGQSGDLTPADKRLYALRDVTATVDSVPLIASSIMSKKLAAGAHSIVLDVKCGSGAFLKTTAEARTLADTMVNIGSALGRNVRALITDMDTPLGSAIGNALEVREAVDVLKGGGPADLKEVCLALAGNMLELAGIPAENAGKALESGAAYRKFCEWIAAQGGDPEAPLPEAKNVTGVNAPASGFITHTDTERIGVAASLLGAGRLIAGDPVDHAAGIVMLAKTGDRVTAGQPIARLYTNGDHAEAENAFLSAVEIGDVPPAPRPLIL